jgi:large subunit ribosomal protein L10
LKKEQKVNLAEEMHNLLEASKAMIVSDYRGLTVEKISVLRNNLRKEGATFRVVKNTLMKKAMPGTPYAESTGLFEGPTAVAIAPADPVGIIKALVAFAKENEKFTIKGGVLGGVLLAPEGIARMAILPPREVLLSRAVGSMKSPLVRMVGSLGSPLRGLVGVLDAIRKAKAA